MGSLLKVGKKKKKKLIYTNSRRVNNAWNFFNLIALVCLYLGCCMFLLIWQAKRTFYWNSFFKTIIKRGCTTFYFQIKSKYKIHVIYIRIDKNASWILMRASSVNTNVFVYSRLIRWYDKKIYGFSIPLFHSNDRTLYFFIWFSFDWQRKILISWQTSIAWHIYMSVL